MPKPKYAKCMICGERIEHVRITKHIGACIRRSGLGRYDRNMTLTNAPDDNHRVHVRVMSEEPSPNYYLHMLAAPGLQLKDLDALIRETWMEGPGDERYESRFSKGDADLTNSDRLHRSQEAMAGANLRYLWARAGGFATYLYDLNMPMTCRIDDFGTYRIDEDCNEVMIVARNEPAEELCKACRAPATRAHSYSSRLNLATKTEYRCEGCSQSDGDQWKPLLNSPRAGARSYDGQPAQTA